MMVVSTDGFASLKYIACLMLALQQKPEQYARCLPLGSRWPAHCTNTTDFTGWPSDGRRITPSPAAAAVASASRPAWSTTLGDLPPPSSGSLFMSYSVKPVACTMAPMSSVCVAPDSVAMSTTKRPGAPSVLATVALRYTLMLLSPITCEARSATPVSAGDLNGSCTGVRL